MLTMFLRYFLFWIFVLGLFKLSGQTATPQEEYLQEELSQKQFNQTEWSRITEGISYAPKKEKEKKKVERDSTTNQGGGNDRILNRRNNRNWGEASKVGLGIMKLLLILSIVFIVFLLLRNFVGITSTPRNRKIKPQASIGGVIDIEKIEENLHESDLDRFIRQALEQQNYALAVRLYYLAILKELSIKKAIQWKKDKTNRTYLQEMRSSPLSGVFEELTLIFERVWYGKNELSNREYEQLAPQFQSFINRLKGT